MVFLFFCCCCWCCCCCSNGCVKSSPPFLRMKCFMLVSVIGRFSFPFFVRVCVLVSTATIVVLLEHFPFKSYSQCNILCVCHPGFTDWVKSTICVWSGGCLGQCNIHTQTHNLCPMITERKRAREGRKDSHYNRTGGKPRCQRNGHVAGVVDDVSAGVK